MPLRAERMYLGSSPHSAPRPPSIVFEMATSVRRSAYRLPKPDQLRPPSSGVLHPVCHVAASGPMIARISRPTAPSTIQSTRSSDVIGVDVLAVNGAADAGWLKAVEETSSANVAMRAATSGVCMESLVACADRSVIDGR